MSPPFTFSSNFLRKDICGSAWIGRQVRGWKTRLVVAIDVPTFVSARRLIETLAGIEVTFKVGYEALYGYGPELLDCSNRVAPRTCSMSNCTIFRARFTRP